MIEIKRRKFVQAWNKALAARKPKAKNPFQDRKSSQGLASIRSTTHWRGQLKAELEAWEAASDEDFEAFETSLG